MSTEHLNPGVPPPPPAQQQVPYPPPSIQPPSIAEMLQDDIQRRIRAQEREKAARLAMMLHAAKMIVDTAKGPPPQMAFLGMDIVADICREWLAAERKKENEATAASWPVRNYEADMATVAMIAAKSLNKGLLRVADVKWQLGIMSPAIVKGFHHNSHLISGEVDGSVYVEYLLDELPKWLLQKLKPELPSATPKS